MTFQTLCFLCFFMEIAGVVETDSKSLGLRLWGSFISGISVFALSIWESYLGAVIFVLVLSLGDPGKGWTSGFVCGLEWWDAQEICTMYDHECLIVVLRGNDTNSGVLVVAPHFRETLLLTFIRWKIWKTLWSEGHNLVTHPLWVLHHGSHWGKGLFHIFSHLFTSCHFQSWTKRAEGGNVLSDHNGSYVFGCSARGTYLRWGDTRWYHLIHLLVLWQSPGCKCSCDEFLYGKVGLWQLFALKMYLLRTEFQCVGTWQSWMWIYHSWDTETAPRSGARNSCGSSLEWQVEICETLWYHIFHILFLLFPVQSCWKHTARLHFACGLVDLSKTLDSTWGDLFQIGGFGWIWTIHLRATSDVCNLHVFGLCWECLHKWGWASSRQGLTNQRASSLRCLAVQKPNPGTGWWWWRRDSADTEALFQCLRVDQRFGMTEAFQTVFPSDSGNMLKCWIMSVMFESCWPMLPTNDETTFPDSEYLGFAGFAMPEREPHHTCRTRCGGRNSLSMLKSLKCFEEEFSWRHAIDRSSLICSNHNIS